MSKGRRRYAIGVAATACAALAGIGAAIAANSFSVTLTSNGPQPETVTAVLGDSVTFLNGESGPVVVSSDRGAFRSDPLAPGQSYQHVLTKSGSYGFVQAGAKIHRGTLVVERAGSVTLAASPLQVPYGTALGLSGRVAPVGFPVQIQTRAAGEREWSDAVAVVPDADGSFRASVRPLKGGQYRATLFGGELASAQLKVEVRPRMLLRTPSRRARTATTLRLTVRIAPARAAAAFDLLAYDRRSRTWKRVASQRADARGVATLRWRVSEGSTLLRARTSRRSLAKGYAIATSNGVRITGVGADPAKRRRS